MSKECSQPIPPSNTHSAFEWLRSQPIDTLNIVLEEYRHKVTGAMHYHLAADNAENVFLVAFRTVPMDSTGVAHILEHTSLCGSKHYPVRDPFFMMIRRSLNTFMNAFTSSDWTAYPFASQNKKDFNNLLDVYLDATFFANLDPLDFAQEGHRVEFESPADPQSDLVFKGVVFNEMKGAMSSPVSTLWQTLTHHLFPTTTYHYNSGGDPKDIPDLTYDQLTAFYRTHYHPSNAVFMTYGDTPAVEHQTRFEERALSQFEALDHSINVPDEQRYEAPIQVKEHYALDESQLNGDQTHLVMGWLLGRNLTLQDVLRAHLLSGVLLDDGASPLRQALETTELGSAPSPLCGLEDSNREMSFVCGLEGSKVENAQALEALIISVLQEVAEKGIPQERVESVLHQLELSQREVSGDGYPYGLHLILNGLSPAIHGGDPVALLDLDPGIEQLRQEIQDPDFIKRLVRENLLDNPHRVDLTLEPDTKLAAHRDQEEAQRLATQKAGMSEADKAEVVGQAKRLAQRQNQEDDPSLLPKVGLEDIPAKMSIPQGTMERVGECPATFFNQGTNGLVYQQIVIPLPELEPELLQLLPYYTSCLAELGAGKRSYLEMQAWQSSVTGGVHASSSVRGAIDDVQNTNGYFVLSGKALVRNSAQLSELMQQTLEQARFDEHSRIREIMAQERAHQEQSVTGHGHSLAMTAASSGMSPVAAMTHQLRGLAGIQFLKELDDGLGETAALKAFADKLARLHQRILAAPRQFLIVGEKEHHQQLKQALDSCLPQTADSPTNFQALTLPQTRHQVRQLWTTNTQVNFCAKCFPTVAVEHPDAPALTVLGGFLRNGYLHRAIREQGGAYGGGASHDTDAAAFQFYSYRDPRLAETLQEFDNSIEWLLNTKHQWRQVEEAILGVISSIDKPSSPAGEAKKTFHSTLYGRTPEQRERFRQHILSVTLEDLQRVGRTYLQPEKASIAVITSSAILQESGDLGLEVHQL
ncbi:MAG: insulinase family protein [Candidatus Polarisedimenticolaceae bacterium]|nr:insulinase family protein [Candidatus Polarisedimenticolaceae bacterium]